MAPVYTSAFTPPTTNKIGAMGAMVPAHFSMTWHNSTGVGILQNVESCQGVICGKSCVQCSTNYPLSLFRILQLKNSAFLRIANYRLLAL